MAFLTKQNISPFSRLSHLPPDPSSGQKWSLHQAEVMEAINISNSAGNHGGHSQGYVPHISLRHSWDFREDVSWGAVLPLRCCLLSPILLSHLHSSPKTAFVYPDLNKRTLLTPSDITSSNRATFILSSPWKCPVHIEVRPMVCVSGLSDDDFL